MAKTIRMERSVESYAKRGRLHKVFRNALKYTSQDLPPLGEYFSEVYHFIPEPRNFSEVTKISVDIKKPWLKATMKDIKN